MPRQKGLSLYELQKRFATEEQCRDYLEQKRWPNGFQCPKCGGNKHYRLSNGMIQCGTCRHQTSVTVGTVMHRSHLPLTKWFLAMYFMSQDKRGISAVRLSQVIGVTYKAAWYLLARLRRAMGQRDDTHILGGTVEFDDAFFGGPTKGKKRGRGTEKAKVFVALSLTDKGYPQYLKMKPTDNIKQASVKRFAQTSIEKGSTIDLVVSRGPQMVEMPDVIGVPQNDAIERIQKAGLIPSCFMVVNDGSLVAGCVVSCSEDAGTMVEAGSVITVYIAADPSVEITTEPPAASDSGSGESASSSGETAPDDTVYDTD